MNLVFGEMVFVFREPAATKLVLHYTKSVTELSYVYRGGKRADSKQAALESEHLPLTSKRVHVIT